jgi:hypothetical protein
MNIGPRPGRGPGCPIPWEGLRPLAPFAPWPLLLILSACAGTPWGDRLSGSFPPAEAPSPTTSDPRPAPGMSFPPPPTAATPISKGPAAPQPSPSPKAPPALNAPPAPKAEPTKPASPPPKPLAPRAPASASASQPFPYRVTLRLPLADPSAPAEAVTRALRSAGIAFEVETIERVQAGAPAPSVRPAPAPR